MKFSASQKVKLSAPLTPAGYSQAVDSLHARSALIVPQGTLSCKEHLFTQVLFAGPPEGIQSLLRKSLRPRTTVASQQYPPRTSRLKNSPLDCFLAAHPLRVRIPSLNKKPVHTRSVNRFLARPKGFEPPIYGIGIRCVIQLRHGRKGI